MGCEIRSRATGSGTRPTGSGLDTDERLPIRTDGNSESGISNGVFNQSDKLDSVPDESSRFTYFSRHRSWRDELLTEVLQSKVAIVSVISIVYRKAIASFRLRANSHVQSTC